MKYLFRIGFILCFLFISFLLLMIVLKPIFISQSIIFPYSLVEFDICQKYPQAWIFIKRVYLLFFLVSCIIISNSIYTFAFKNISFCKKFNSQLQNNLNLFIGTSYIGKEKVFISEYGLYQNFLITGTIGSGKTSAAMYPFTKQLIKYANIYSGEKIGMLVLDVKGNFHKKVKEYIELYDREDDLIVISLGGNIKYNPLHKPNIKPSVLANRLKTILTLFSPNNSDSYWLDKAEASICEAIKLCRLYNNNYVTFQEIHNLITDEYYFNDKIFYLRSLFQSAKLDKKQVYDLLSALNFFENEFKSLDSRVLSILKSEITRITNIFLNDIDVFSTFCPKEDELNFFGFEDVVQNFKVVVLNMNIAQYRDLSKIIATYLKLDFQSEVISSLSKTSIKTTAFICDEFHEYVTTTDADFFAQSREAKCINIVATQSYTSIINAIKDEYASKVIIQNLVNKLWFRTDDIYTIEEIQKQIGKEDKEKKSTNFSENANKVSYNYLLNSLHSSDSTFSESISTYYQHEFIYDTNFFTQQLQTFSCLGFFSNGSTILKPRQIDMTPYFKENI